MIISPGPAPAPNMITGIRLPPVRAGRTGGYRITGPTVLTVGKTHRTSRGNSPFPFGRNRALAVFRAASGVSSYWIRSVSSPTAVHMRLQALVAPPATKAASPKRVGDSLVLVCQGEGFPAGSRGEGEAVIGVDVFDPPGRRPRNPPPEADGKGGGGSATQSVLTIEPLSCAIRERFRPTLGVRAPLLSWAQPPGG